MTGDIRRGVVLVDLLAISVAMALGGSLLVPILQQARMSARDARNMSQMSQAGRAVVSYSVEYQDRIATFSWRAGNPQGAHTIYEDLRRQSTNATAAEAASAQAIDILRRRVMREDLAPVRDWLPHVNAWPLVLTDYLASRLPDEMFVSPYDVHRLAWQEQAGRRFDAGAFAPHQPEPSPANAVMPFSSSYSFTTSGFDFAGSSRTLPPGSRLRLGEGWDRYVVPSTARLGDLRYHQVQFPSGKAMFVDTFDRSKPRWSMHSDPHATVMMTQYDGSVMRRPGGEVNPGWDPWRPETDATTVMRFSPRPWEGVHAEGEAREQFLRGGVMWTRGGLQGVDIDHAEARTGQPGVRAGAHADERSLEEFLAGARGVANVQGAVAR
ncbi:MAG: hypothetical protein KIT24_07805 [Phycisphaeraceae bacterium]|nr:hypothetical protein [Phycisphaeraceae bacterium]